MKKSNLFLKRPFAKLFFSILLAGIASCNNGDKKGDSKDDDKSTTTTDKTNAGQSANAITFTNYKLDTATMSIYEKDPYKAKLLLLKIRLDDLKDPTSITLWGYPAKDHKHFAYNEPPFELSPAGDPPSVMDTKDILIGDNELDLKTFHVDGKLNKPFLPFGYILLTPYKRGDGNLVFKIAPYNDKAIAPLADFPTESNPIPPGKPEEN